MSGFPWLEAHQLLNMAPSMFATRGFDLEEHNRLFEKHYPPQNNRDRKILDITCTGHLVPEHLTKEDND